MSLLTWRQASNLNKKAKELQIRILVQEENHPKQKK